MAAASRLQRCSAWLLAQMSTEDRSAIEALRAALETRVDTMAEIAAFERVLGDGAEVLDRAVAIAKGLQLLVRESPDGFPSSTPVVEAQAPIGTEYVMTSMRAEAAAQFRERGVPHEISIFGTRLDAKLHVDSQAVRWEADARVVWLDGGYLEGFRSGVRVAVSVTVPSFTLEPHSLLRRWFRAFVRHHEPKASPLDSFDIVGDVEFVTLLVDEALGNALFDVAKMGAVLSVHQGVAELVWSAKAWETRSGSVVVAARVLLLLRRSAAKIALFGELLDVKGP